MPHIFVVGDSITWGAWDVAGGGWVNRLRQRIDAYQVDQADFWCPVYNLGISGNKSADLLRRFSAEVKARLADNSEAIVLIAIGINDSQVDLTTGQGVVTVEQYLDNLGQIYRQAQSLASIVGFIGLTPVDQSKVDPLPWAPERAFRNDRIALFERTCQNFCQSQQIPFLPIFDQWNQLNYQALLSDGLHPNDQGHQLLFQTVSKFLEGIASLGTDGQQLLGPDLFGF